MAGLDEAEKRAAVGAAVPLPTAYVRSAASLFPVSPVSPVFRENVRSAVLLWPVNF
ncbi:MAG: hypothetical protein NTX75_00810 [Proteobacteria bacterium]|nr:hypothetical protein [Pseudomonadota bacterium]